MDFRTEFFPLLNKALYKENNDVPTHIIKNGDVYLMDRYTSFYNPKLTFIINNTINKFMLNFTKDDSGKYLYEILKSSIPKLPKAYIPYVAKTKSDFVKKADEFVKYYANKNNMSEREVWIMIYQLDVIK